MNNSVIFKNYNLPARREFATRRETSSRQDKNLAATQEGVLVNNFILTSGDRLASLIPQSTSMPDDLYISKEKISKFPAKNPLFPLVLAPLLILGGAAGISILARKTLVNRMKKLTVQIPDIGRNVNINKETIFNVYNFFLNPTPKNLLTAVAIFTATAVGFVMKNFADGLKEVWVKKKEADIKRKLEESLISIETRSFSGKNQILRSIVTKKSQEMNKIIDSISFRGYKKQLYSDFMKKPAFEKNDTKKSKFADKNWTYALVAAGTIAAGGLLIGIIFKNIKLVAQQLKESREIAAKSQNKIIEELSKFHELPKECGGHPGKIGVNSFVEHATAFIYMFLTHPTAQTGGLLAGAYTVSSLSYIGSKAVEAIKEVKVKETNAETERQLQDRLVQVELKNFLAKKESFVEPLVNEFKQQAKVKPDKEHLQKIADNVLFEIKNGPPFVYS